MAANIVEAGLQAWPGLGGALLVGGRECGSLAIVVGLAWVADGHGPAAPAMEADPSEASDGVGVQSAGLTAGGSPFARSATAVASPAAAGSAASRSGDERGGRGGRIQPPRDQADEGDPRAPAGPPARIAASVVWAALEGMGVQLGPGIGRECAVRRVTGFGQGCATLEAALPVGTALGPVGVSPLRWGVDSGLVGGSCKLRRAAVVEAHATMIRELHAAGNAALAEAL